MAGSISHRRMFPDPSLSTSRRIRLGESVYPFWTCSRFDLGTNFRSAVSPTSNRRTNERTEKPTIWSVKIHKLPDRLCSCPVDRTRDEVFPPTLRVRNDSRRIAMRITRRDGSEFSSHVASPSSSTFCVITGYSTGNVANLLASLRTSSH